MKSREELAKKYVKDWTGNRREGGREVKLQLINCGSKCNWCDGYGIMTLEPGHIEAPCLLCSADKNIHDLYLAREKAVRAFELAKELELIDEHNKRLRDAEEEGK